MIDDGHWYAMPVLAGSRAQLEPLRYELAAVGSADEAAEIFDGDARPEAR